MAEILPETYSGQQAQQSLQEAFDLMSTLLKKIKRAFHMACARMLADLQKGLTQMNRMLHEAFAVSSFSEYQQTAALCGQALAASLYALQRDLEGLKNAIIRAASPLAAVFVPVVRQAVQALTGLANSVYKVLGALFGGTGSLDAFTGSMQGAVSAGTALKRTLAGFDEINRLGSSSGPGLVGGFIGDLDPHMSDQLRGIVEAIRSLLAPLQKINLEPLAQAFERLKKALAPITKTLFAGLEWAWHNLLVPLAQWTIEDLLPVFLDTMSTALQGLQKIITELQPAFTWLWENFLKPLAQWAGSSVIASLRGIQNYLNGVGDWVGQNQSPVDAFIGSMNEAIYAMEGINQRTAGWNRLGTVATAVAQTFGSAAHALHLPLGNTNTALNGINSTMDALAGTMDGVGTTSNTLWGSLQEVWGGAWRWLKTTLLDPMLTGVKSSVNSIIAFLNSVIRAVADAVNMVVDTVNQLHFTVPDWVPLIGGNSFGFSLRRVAAPQIPYLAKGAVLPANRPFMAVLGDQRHGTNIEAPLATIEAALQNVLSGELGGIMAGFNAVTQRQERILEAILGIDLSDSAIYSAAARYNEKLAVMTGGSF